LAKHQYDAAVHHGSQAVEDLLRVAAGCLTAVVRTEDVVARVGRHSFGVIGIECDRVGAKALLARLNESLSGERVEASIAIAHRAPPLLTLAHAWNDAERIATAGRSAT
jgi:GGDEF domain-containing protein